MNCVLEGKAFRNDVLGSETLAANDLFPDRGTGLRHSPIPRGHVHSRNRAELGSTEKPVGGFEGLHPGRSPGWSQGRDPCFLIGEDDRVYEGRGWSTMGAHAKNWNDKSLGISFLGSFSKTAPDITTLTVAKSLIQCAVSGGFLSESYTLKGHRDMKLTECPGDALYETISQWPEFEA
ncbi:peptidoglycan recognition protein 1-like [Eretmochelys imbricata]